MTTILTEIEEQAVDNPSPYAGAHIAQYLESDGEEVDHPMADALVLLHTTGKRTGRIRRTPLAAFEDGDDLIVIASKGGAPVHPSWFWNLKADPTVWVRQKKDFFEAEAEPLQGDEYDEMWRRVTKWNPNFQAYQDKTERVIPLVRLTRV
jgi:deazaflavin-dependent oxidoreductase (nitroreductase family)